VNSGLVVIDKPLWKTSAFIDRICKKIFNCSKAGHIGTLDPFATGVLVVALGDATKLIPYIKIERKTYVFEIAFGTKTNTADISGTIIKVSTNIPNFSSLEDTIAEFVGTIDQRPHPFSAVKINGKKAYEISRRGEIPVLKAKRVQIFEIKLLEQIEENVFKLEATVSPGTYIRSLAEDIASRLETFCFVKSLKRTKDGRFDVTDSITVDKLRDECYNNAAFYVPLEDVLDDILVVFVSDREAADIRLGKTITLDSEVCRNGLVSVQAPDGLYAIAEAEGQTLAPKRIIRSMKGDFDVDKP
jgi:tRNA pseudouridine55 synthase